MNKYTTRWIIALLSLALVGLLCVQLYWVNNAVDMKRELFRQSVNSAMSAVVSKLEKHEVACAVAQTVYAGEMTPTDQAPMPPPEQSTPAPEPPSPVASQPVARTQPARQPAVAEPPSMWAHSASNSMPVIISHSNHPYSFTAVNGGGGGVRTQSGPTIGIYDGSRAASHVQMIHLDSMRNIMRMYMDSSLIREQFIVRQMPRVTVNRTNGRKNNRSEQSVIVQTEWQPDTTFMQWEATARAYGSGSQVNVRINNLEQKIEDIHNMVDEVFQEPITVECNEAFPLPRGVWMYEAAPVDTAFYREARAVHTRLKSSASAGSSARAEASSTAAAPAPARQRQRRQQQAANSGQAAAGSGQTVAAANRSDRDKLVSIKDMASRVVTELATGFRPIDQRITPSMLDSLLQSELAQRGITLPYRYAVLSENNSFALATPASHDNELKKSAFRAALYPNDIIADPYFLSIYFPRQDEFVYESMWSVLGTSLLFILLILGCFSFTLITLTRQKKLSDMKTDFINNMTHELKTPIATISLASEALQDPAVRVNDNRVTRFINAIYEENRRLGSQVERVLQAAVIDRGEVRISPSTVCVHDVMSEALKTIALQVESRGGTVECRFEAEHDCIQADRVHLTNVIVNLLDNANKYSPESPRIVLSTATTSGGIIISVEDNGIGMSRDAQKRIFEQFYRVSTGNVHDVKGFGLGLSYVKAMVEAHGGTITVRSEPRQGSRFDLFLPLAGREAVHA